MNSLRRLWAAAVLTLACTLPAAAGEISTGVGASQPPPPPAATAQGDMPFPQTAARTVDSEADDSLALAMLGLLRSALSLL